MIRRLQCYSTREENSSSRGLSYVIAGQSKRYPDENHTSILVNVPSRCTVRQDTCWDNMREAALKRKAGPHFGRFPFLRRVFARHYGFCP